MSIATQFTFDDGCMENIFAGCEVQLSKGPKSEDDLIDSLIESRWTHLPGSTIELYLLRLRELEFLRYDSESDSYSLAE